MRKNFLNEWTEIEREDLRANSSKKIKVWISLGIKFPGKKEAFSFPITPINNFLGGKEEGFSHLPFISNW